ncbi:MAG: AfsR/SARP family transcriptional regulator [Caldilineaceae bacterium]
MIQQQLTHEQTAPSDTHPVTISLFGAFALTVNGASVTTFRSNKTRALLIYLLLTDAQPLPRLTISELLWAGYVDQSAQANLRQTWANLRNCLEPVDLLQSSRTHLSLQHDPTRLWCDVHQFEALLDACQHHAHRALAECIDCRARLQQAVALYQAPLLETFTALDSPPFNTWLQRQRARLAERLAEAQAILAANATTPGNLPPLLTPLVGRATLSPLNARASSGRCWQLGCRQ